MRLDVHYDQKLAEHNIGIPIDQAPDATCRPLMHFGT